nr:cyclin-SDS [Ipomoea trifida]
MVSELAGEGAMSPQLLKLASHAELQVRLRRQIRRGSSLCRGVNPAKTVALFNPSTMFIPLSLDESQGERRVSDLKNRVGELRFEIEAATTNIEEAKQIKESMKRKWFPRAVTKIDPLPPNFAVKKHLQSKLPCRIFDDYSLAYSELRSDILQESSDLDFSKYSPSVWSTYALEHSPFLEEHNISDEISLVLEEEDGERYRMLRNKERRQGYGGLVVQERLQMFHWIVQQSTKKELLKETMFLGVNLFDQFLTKGLFDQVEQSSQQKPNNSSEFDGQQDGEISQNDQPVGSETSNFNSSVADQDAVVETIAIVTHEKAKKNETREQKNEDLFADVFYFIAVMTEHKQ